MRKSWAVILWMSGGLSAVAQAVESSDDSMIRAEKIVNESPALARHQPAINPPEAPLHKDAFPPIYGGPTLRVQPSPKPQLREMNGLTLSPFTVDVGHVQIESYVGDYSYARDTSDGGDKRSESWSIAATTIKYGVLHDLDLELEISPYTRGRTVDRVAGTVNGSAASATSVSKPS